MTLSRTDARNRLRESWGIAAATAIFAFFSILIILPKYPPFLYDYPDWVYEGVLLRDFLLGHPHGGYVLKPYPVPFSLDIFLIGAMATFMRWTLAAKLVWVLDAGFVMAAMKHLMTTLGRRDPFVWLIVPTFLLINQTWWWGASGFLLGLPLDILAVSYFLRGKLGARQIILLTLAAFFTHAVHLIALGFLVVAEAARRHSLRPLFYLAPASLLTLWYLYGRYVLFHNAEQMHIDQTIPTFSILFLLFKINDLVKSTGFANPLGQGGPVLARWFGTAGIGLLQILAAVSAGCVVWLSLTHARAVWKARAEKPVEALLLAVMGIWMLIFLLTPQTFLGLGDFGQRFLEITLATGLFIAFRPSLAGKILCATSILFVATNFALISYISDNPDARGAPAALPGPMARFSAMDPASRWTKYRAIESGNMTEEIYPTALFLQK